VEWVITAVPDSDEPVEISFTVETEDPAVIALVERAAAEAGIELRRKEPSPYR
jgi:hypothetical protein